MTPPLNPTLAHLPAMLGWGLLAVAIVGCWRAQRPPESATAHDWHWWLLAAGVLLCFRWPLIWLPHELYPDESQMLAGAITLRHDPVFWRSVDGGTAGPLDFYPLLPAAFVSGVSSYAVARLIATAMVWGLLVAGGETIALVASRAVARAAVLPPLAFAAFTTSPEFVHYSTELVPSLLLGAVGYVGMRQSVRPSGKNPWIAGLLLGATPFAKLQAAPIAAGLGLLLLIQEIRTDRKKNLGPLVIAALLPTLAAGLMVTATGQVENFVIPYFLNNLAYTQSARLPIGQVILQQWEQAMTNGYLALWLVGSVAFLTVAPFLSGPVSSPHRRNGLAAATLAGLTLSCILAPGRPYNHYLNLLILPWCLLLGAALAGRSQAATARRPLVLALFLVYGLLPQVALRASPRVDPFEHYNTTATAPTPAHRRLVALVQSVTTPGEALGIWGWRSSLYVETGLRQATREAHTEAQLSAGPWHQYYARRYYEDLTAVLPPVFVDAVGPGNFRYQDRQWGHEWLPRLGEWVRTYYYLAADLDGVRVYVRNDRRPAVVN